MTHQTPDVAPRGSPSNGRAVSDGHSLDIADAALVVADDKADEHETELIAFRRRLHAEPELSFEEVATTDAVMERLAVDGMAPVRLPSGTGLYCVIGEEGPLVALRADLDALAMDDVKDVPYRSRNPGVTHACGHDVHTAVVLGAGLVLNRLACEGLLPGRVRLIFEPGEEKVPGGALEVVDLGLLRDVAAIFAVHCDPKLDVGVVGTRIGAITSASDLVEVTLHGPGGHTARPNLTVDLVSVMADLVLRLPVEVERRMGGADNCRMVFGAIHTGAAANVIPARGVVTGSLRSPNREAWDLAPEALEESLQELLAASGAEWELRHVRGVPPVINDEAAAKTLARCARSLLGDDGLVETEHSWGGDSFGWMTNEAPGAFVRLGTHNPLSDAQLDLHHSHFDVDEGVIAIGVRLLVRVVLQSLVERSG